MPTTLDQVIEIAKRASGRRRASENSALIDDLRIIGDDADDLIDLLCNRFGDWVDEWPWHRFLDFDEGRALQAPIRKLWQILHLPWIETAFPQPPVLERLELGHIAAVIEKGQWFEP